MALINPGFEAPKDRRGHVPPGQSEVQSWPVLTYGPTPEVDLATWTLTVEGEVAHPITLNWSDFNALASTAKHADIHCVTRWTRLGMDFSGVSLDDLIAAAGGLTGGAHYMIAGCYGGYTTNLPVADVTGGKALVATSADSQPLAPEHGWPARLVVPHLYFWKSAKWVNSLTFVAHDEPGFWEANGYHNYGDPWREQRYTDDI